jgi:hypothetical protein
MANGWTPERKARQAALIREWRPWEQSTGPRSAEGKSTVSRNAWQGGARAALCEVAQALASNREMLNAASRWLPVPTAERGKAKSIKWK